MISRAFADNPNFRLQLDMCDIESLQSAQLMVTDWSGSGLEFVLGTERRVIFINTPPKITNREYQTFGYLPLEQRVRTELGQSLSLSQVEQLPKCIEQSCEAVSVPAAQSFREQWVYNNGSSAEVAADYINRLLH
jgi:hypothetical protein